MPTYKLECDGCGKQWINPMTFAEYDEFKAVPREHTRCGIWRFVLSFNIARSLPAHFNTSLGQYVTNQAAANSALSRASDEASARMGFDHQFEFVDPGDAASVGVTEAGLDATRKRDMDNGKTAPKLIF